MTERVPSQRALRQRRMHDRLLKRIYALCRSGEWQLRLECLDNENVCHAIGLVDEHGHASTNNVGMLDPVRRIIYVDFRHDVIATFVHECLHALVDSTFNANQHTEEEMWVREHERLIMRHLTPLQARRLLAFMAHMQLPPRRE